MVAGIGKESEELLAFALIAVANKESITNTPSRIIIFS